MSFCRLVTRATFTPGCNSSSYRVTVGPTVRPFNVTSTPCDRNDSSSKRPRSLISASSMACLPERLSNDAAGSTHSLGGAAGVSSRPCVRLGCFGSRRALAPLRFGRRLFDFLVDFLDLVVSDLGFGGVVVGQEGVVHPFAGILRFLGLTGDRVGFTFGVHHLAKTRPDTPEQPRQHRTDRVDHGLESHVGDQEQRTERQSHEHQRGTDGPDERRQCLTDGGADPTTCTTQRVDSGEGIGAAHDVQLTERRQHHGTPAQRQLHATGSFVAPQQRHTDGHRHQRQSVAGQTHDGAQSGVRPAADRTREAHVHRQSDEHAQHEKGDGRQLVFAPRQGLAHLAAGVRLTTGTRRWGLHGRARTRTRRGPRLLAGSGGFGAGHQAKR
jgi:hypothetical protein